MAKQKIALVSASDAPVPQRRIRRRSKLDAILEGATALFNEQGVGAVSLADVAERVGVGRATLYHYVSDREDLIFQCYRRSCEAETERLAVAAEHDDPLDGLLNYFREGLSNASSAAVITDLGFMSSDSRSVIAKAVRRNHAALCGLISSGIERQRIRPCDERIVAHALTAMMSHFRVAERWVDLSSTELDVDALVESTRIGAVVDRTRVFQCNIDAERFNRLKAATFGPGGMTEMRVEQILTVASRMFNARGVEAVSLDEIATELGATRGAVYHYFSDKEDLIRRCAERAHELYAAFMEAGENNGSDSFEKLSIVSHLNSQAHAGFLQPLTYSIGLDTLSPGQRQRHRQRLQARLRESVALAEEGIAAGDRQPFDPRTLAVARAGAFSWFLRWEPSIEDVTPFRVADELVAFFNQGLAPFKAGIT